MVYKKEHPSMRYKSKPYINKQIFASTKKAWALSLPYSTVLKSRLEYTELSCAADRRRNDTTSKRPKGKPGSHGEANVSS